MLLLVLISFAPLFTLQAEVFLNYNGFNPIVTVPSASAAYNTASSGSSPATKRLSTAAITTTYAQQQVQWPSTAVRNDWYILQTAANAAVAAAATTQADATPGNRLQKPHEAMTKDKPSYSASHNSYDTPHVAQQQQQQQNPPNYYTYNRSNSGNYRTSAQDMHFVAPYVWAISNQRRPSTPSGERSRRREHSNNTADNAVNILNNRRYVNTYNNKSASQHNKFDGNAQSATNNVNNVAAIAAQPQHPAVLGWQDIESRSVGEGNAGGNGDSNAADIEESLEVGSVENDINSLKEAQFNEVFVPLGNALDKVQHFCDVFRRIISDDEEDFAFDDLVTMGSSAEAVADTASVTTAQSAAVDAVIPAGDNAQLSLEVQGQRSPPTAIATTAAHLSTQQSQPMAAVTASEQTTTITNASSNTPNSAKSLTSTALTIGRGKKLKKKLKKLMLPLLLAYKLKFIALVPLLIGGLTLLVGSTGLAGFFFALFLTVMSLKGGGSVNKSIVIKKVW